MSRASDILSRIEATRFSVLMPETRKSDADIVAERLKGQLVEYLSEMGGKLFGRLDGGRCSVKFGTRRWRPGPTERGGGKYQEGGI